MARGQGLASALIGLPVREGCDHAEGRWLHTYCVPPSLPRKPSVQPGAGWGARNRLKGPAAPTGVLQTEPRCVHSAGLSGAGGRQEKPRKDTASVWGLARPLPLDTGIVLGLERGDTISRHPLCPAMLGASRSGGKLSAPQGWLWNPRGPLQIPAAGPLFSNWGHSQGGHSRAEPRARPAQGSGETARGVLGGVWRQEHERDRQAREGHEGALPGAWGRPARVCRKEAGGTGWGPEPLIPRACDPRRILGREWRKLESGVEESRPVSWEAGSCPPPPGPCRSGGPLTPHFPGELHMPRCHMGSKAMPVGSHHAGPLGLLVK